MTPLARPFTPLVAGRPILSFYASNFREAQELPRETWLRADLVHRRSGEHCLWDGKAKLSIRAATGGEQEMLSLADQGAGDDDGILLAYLVAIEKDQPNRAEHYESNDVEEAYIDRSPPG